MSLHDQIMNLPAPDYSVLLAMPDYAAKIGHRDARHAAAELALKADAQIERLRHALAFYADPTRYHGPNQRAEEGDPYTEAGPYMLDVTRDAGMLARAVLASA